MEAGRGEEGRRHHSLQLFLKYTGGENVSHGVQSEGLAMMEGTRVDVKDNSVAYDIDTSKSASCSVVPSPPGRRT